MLLAGTLILYVGDGLNRDFLNLQTRIERSRGAASVGAGAARVGQLFFCAARVRATSHWSLHDILLR